MSAPVNVCPCVHMHSLVFTCVYMCVRTRVEVRSWCWMSSLITFSVLVCGKLSPMIQLGWPEGELQDSLSAAPELGSFWSLVFASLTWLRGLSSDSPRLNMGWTAPNPKPWFVSFMEATCTQEIMWCKQIKQTTCASLTRVEGQSSARPLVWDSNACVLLSIAPWLGLQMFL